MESRGLVLVKSGADLKFEDAAAKAAAAERERSFIGNANAVPRLSGYLQKAWERNRDHRSKLDDRLLACLRARMGRYSNDQLSKIQEQSGADPVYLKLTGTKCRAASAWVRDILMPAGDRPWSLTPTPEPSLPGRYEDAIREQAINGAVPLIQQGILQGEKDVMDFIAATRDKVMGEIRKEAEQAAKRMEDKIADIMAEGEWETALDEFVEDFVTYPVAYLKGPYPKKIKKLVWGKDYQPVPTETIAMCWRRVSPFDIYPAPYSRNLQDQDMIERLRLTHSQLYDMMGLEGYSEEDIKSALQDYEYGNLKDWIWVDYERTQLESDTSYFTTDPSTIDALHFYGSVPGDILEDWGLTVKDKHKSYEVDAILVGRHVIRAVINDDPLASRPYFSACWDPVPGSIFGIALPEQMDDHQKIVNACARALCNNMAIASGPQVVILTDMLAEGEDIQGIHPMKIWQMKSSQTGNSGKPVEFFQPEANSAELINVLNDFEKRADDVTNVPRYSYGNQDVGGAGNTATGLSMLMNSAAKGIRRAIANIDMNVMRPTVYQTFLHVMQTSDDMTIKGDCTVIPRGAAALLVKEQNLTRVQAFLNQTANPIDAQIMGPTGRAVLLSEAAKLMDLPADEIVPPPDKIKLMAEQAQAMAGGPPQGAGTPPSNPATLNNDQLQMGTGQQAQITQNKMTPQ